MQTTPRIPQEHRNIDVVTLFAPRRLPDADFERSIADWSTPNRAVLVVLADGLDERALDRLHLVGADLCVVAPSSEELFTHVERARGRHRMLRTGRTIRDEQLDTLWRERFRVARNVDVHCVATARWLSPP